MKRKSNIPRSALPLFLFAVLLLIASFSLQAADVYTPSGSNSFMYPGEPVSEDEMRVTIFGSGYGYVRAGQADQSIYVELGNGDAFVFDLGEGSEANYMTMQVAYSRMTNLFVTHHHMDHLGSLPHLYTFGPSADRWTPLNIYGPSGDTPELGTKYMVDGLKRFTNWHVTSFNGIAIPESDGYEINVHEFDYRLNPGIAYEKNGVVIKSFPVAHSIDGGVGYRVEWNGLCAVIASDTRPSQFYIENSKNCDIVMHEVGPDPGVFAETMGVTIDRANSMIASSHTLPVALGKIFALTKPRLAVGTHILSNANTTLPTIDGLRKYYDGPLVIAEDFMVFNITRDKITQRVGVGPRNPWMHTEAKSTGTPKFKKDNLNSDLILNSVIPACKDAKDDEICY
ncbi:MAG: guanitoxin biosynthesis MBL fold metallo-hydrolase GntH [Thermoanaerobaculia bacterium]